MSALEDRMMEVMSSTVEVKKRDAILIAYDLTGYTTFADYHESRDDHMAVARLTHLVCTGSNGIIEDAGGTMESFIGDGYIGFFRANAYRRAIDSALEIQEYAKELRDKAGIPGSDNPMLKVALYKGSSLFGQIGDEKDILMGRAPSKLIRIVSEARPGEVLASGSVMNPVIDSYEVDKLIGISLKGIANMRDIYRVKGKK